ncbi:MAG: hypothetical protein J1E85_01940 [Ruminococcus sp.]|nr:hypothetical protein [Ruminococcus sp.]
MIRRIGAHTIGFEEMPSIIGHAGVAGKVESQGPLADCFDKLIFDSYNGKDTYEQAESSLQAEAVSLAISKAKTTADEINYIFAGDLLNQCIGSSYGLLDFKIPYLGQYGACSTMAQGLIMASVFVESGAAKAAMCVTSSHFCSAERQYRFPLEYGGVRTPTAQWTVTGAGSCVLRNDKKGPSVARATVGKIIDLGVKDANNMGAAMAPAMGIIGPRVIGAIQFHRIDGHIFACPSLKSSATRQGYLRFCLGQSKICSAYPIVWIAPVTLPDWKWQVVTSKILLRKECPIG